MSGSYSQRWGDEKRFFELRCKKATHHEQWTAEHTLYAHYRRWALLSDRGAHKRETFVSHLVKRFRKAKREVNGFTLWPLWLKPPAGATGAGQRKHQAEKPNPSPRGRVKLLESMTFCDGKACEGTELDWMEPTELERHALKQEWQRQQEDGRGEPVSWLIIVFQGKRRRVPGDMVETLV